MVGTIFGILHTPLHSFRSGDTIPRICSWYCDIPRLIAIFRIWYMEYMAHHKWYGVPAFGIMRNSFYDRQSKVCPLVGDEFLRGQRDMYIYSLTIYH